MHLRVEEKITLLAKRDGGLENLEIHGLVSVHISDDKFGQIQIHLDNKDDKGIQLQVLSDALYCYVLLCTTWPPPLYSLDTS